VVPVLKEMRDALGTPELAHRVGLHGRSVERALDLVVRPHASTQSRYLETSRRWCEGRLIDAGWRVSHDPLGTIWCYREYLGLKGLRICLVCGRPVRDSRAKYCSPKCKKRAYRARLAAR
jgi:hypothetical protein